MTEEHLADRANQLRRARLGQFSAAVALALVTACSAQPRPRCRRRRPYRPLRQPRRRPSYRRHNRHLRRRRDQRLCRPASLPLRPPDRCSSPRPRGARGRDARSTLRTAHQRYRCMARDGRPDSSCTPGAIFPDGGSDQVCRSGYSSTVRNVPAELSRQVYAAYGVIERATGQYQVDHLVPLEIDGSNDIANLPRPPPRLPCPARRTASRTNQAGLGARGADRHIGYDGDGLPSASVFGSGAKRSVLIGSRHELSEQALRQARR